MSAELTLTPAAKHGSWAFDRSMIAAYGHDDRSCSFAALDALLRLDEIPEYTAVCCLADKEEIGSMGITGMESQAFEYFMERLCHGQKCQPDGLLCPLRVPVRRCDQRL